MGKSKATEGKTYRGTDRINLVGFNHVSARYHAIRDMKSDRGITRKNIDIGVDDICKSANEFRKRLPKCLTVPIDTVEEQMNYNPINPDPIFTKMYFIKPYKGK